MFALDQEKLKLYEHKYGPLLENKKGHEHIIGILKEIQDTEGYLPKESLALISEKLQVPLADIYGVATFYNFFKLHASGKYKIMICEGTACHVKGAPNLLGVISQELGIEPGQVSADRQFSLEIVRCLGLCASAPVLMINEKIFPKVNEESCKAILAEYKKK
ncbi:MAG: NAD(P)H-dependent oxidoreductase subunit E [Candidatus Woesearchaeota archaeon]